MPFTTVFIRNPKSWDELSRAIRNMTRNVAAEVRYCASVEELSGDARVVDVVVMELKGAAHYALEIYWKGLCDVADDAVAMYLALSLDDDVICSDVGPNPQAWLLTKPSGTIDDIDLDIEQLDGHGRVVYKVRRS